MIRVLHTADWHLGHTHHGFSRDAEHQAFLRWLLDQVEVTSAHALIIAGDIFDSANPSALAQQRWYDFLFAYHQRFPHRSLIAVGGNHDSAARLDAPAQLLNRFGLRVVGGLPRTPSGRLQVDRCIVPISDVSGTILGVVLAVPFLRPFDLPRSEDAASAIELIYRELVNIARARYPKLPILATGHATLVNARLSDTERPLVPSQSGLPLSIFPSEISYIAMGHLHLAQQLGSPRIQYSGSPLPLSMTERNYCHCILQIEIDDQQLTSVPIPIPRSAPFLRIPDEGFDSLEAICSQLSGMPAHDSIPSGLQPFLEIYVTREQSLSRLRSEIHRSAVHRAVRITNIRTPDVVAPLPSSRPTPTLSRIDDVFRERIFRKYGREPNVTEQQMFELLRQEIDV